MFLQKKKNVSSEGFHIYGVKTVFILLLQPNTYPQKLGQSLWCCQWYFFVSALVISSSTEALDLQIFVCFCHQFARCFRW